VPAVITLWTIYNPPMSLAWIARRSLVARGDELLEADEAGECIKLSSDLKALRDDLKSLGLTCYGRDPEDDPTIVEVWLTVTPKPQPAHNLGVNNPPKYNPKMG
jgi:hypothetical protein